MLFNTDTNYLQRSRWQEMINGLNHPSTDILVNFPVKIPEALFDVWCTKACDIAGRLVGCPPAQQAAPIPHRNAQPDCMALDFAITGTLDAPNLSIIEAQTYPGTFHLSLALEHVYGNTSLNGKSTESRRTLVKKSIVGSQPHNTIMLTQELMTLKTCVDFMLAQSMDGITPVLLREIYQHNGKWWYFTPAGSRRVERIYNRIIYHKLDEHEKHILHGLMADPSISWYSDPSWFYTISKASLAAFSHENNPAVRPLSEPIPADLDNWVLKCPDGHSGKGIVIGPTPAHLQEANIETDFLQQRVTYLPCIVHPQDPARTPLTGELRFMLMRQAHSDEWHVMTTLIRVSEDGNIPRAMSSNNPYEGATIAISV